MASIHQGQQEPHRYSNNIKENKSSFRDNEKHRVLCSGQRVIHNSCTVPVQFITPKSYCIIALSHQPKELWCQKVPVPSAESLALDRYKARSPTPAALSTHPFHFFFLLFSKAVFLRFYCYSPAMVACPPLARFFLMLSTPNMF